MLSASDQDRSSRLFHDADGLLRATLDGEGYLVENSYDAAGQIQRTVRHATPVPEALRASSKLDALRPAVSSADREEWRFHNARGELLAQVDAEGYLDEYQYDTGGRLILTLRYAYPVSAAQLAAVQAAIDTTALLQALRPSVNTEDRKHTTRYDLLDRIVEETDAQGSLTHHRYNLAGQRIATTRAFDSDGARSQHWRYDLLGRLVAQMDGEGSAALEGLRPDVDASTREAIWNRYATHYGVDASGRRLSATDANGSQSRYWYDEDGQLRYSVNGLGEVREERYDVLGQRSASITHAQRIMPSASAAGGLLHFYDQALVVDDAQDSVRRHAWLRDGLLASSVDELGNITRYGYDAFDGLLQTTLPQSSDEVTVLQRQYDRRGLLLSESWIDAGSGAALLISGRWDAFGQQISSTDAMGNTRLSFHDRLGREVASIDALGHQRSNTWDAFGRNLAQTDALGNTVRTEYDRQQRSSSLITAEGIRITTVRNRHDETERIIDGRGTVTTMRYDASGRLLDILTPLTNTRRSYDLGGRLTQSLDANGIRTVYDYDAANRLLGTVRDPDSLRLETRQSWDAKGQLIASEDARGVQTLYRYDLKGQLLEQVLDPNGLHISTGHSWDAQGRMLDSRDANGIISRARYDAFGRLIEQVRDPNGLNLSTRYTLDGNGNVLAMVDANGARQEQRYDANNRLTVQVDGAGGLTQIDYDAEGRRIFTRSLATPLAGSVAGLDAAGILALAPSDDAHDRREMLYYDHDGRLVTTISGLGAQISYRYDANGNLVDQRSLSMRSPRPASLKTPTCSGSKPCMTRSTG
jgi:YD repeat-containing protein